MRPPFLPRALTPLGWLVLAVLAAALILVAGRGVGLRWDPLDLAGRRQAATEARLEAALADAAARRLEIEGAAAQADRLDHHHRQTRRAAQGAARAVEAARTAHDALEPLDPDRLARLRQHDRQLCELASAVCVAAPPDAAAGGDQPLPAGPTAGLGQPG